MKLCKKVYKPKISKVLEKSFFKKIMLYIKKTSKQTTKRSIDKMKILNQENLFWLNNLSPPNFPLSPSIVLLLLKLLITPLIVPTIPHPPVLQIVIKFNPLPIIHLGIEFLALPQIHIISHLVALQFQCQCRQPVWNVTVGVHLMVDQLVRLVLWLDELLESHFV